MKKLIMLFTISAASCAWGMESAPPDNSSSAHQELSADMSFEEVGQAIINKISNVPLAQLLKKHPEYLTMKHQHGGPLLQVALVFDNIDAAKDLVQAGASIDHVSFSRVAVGGQSIAAVQFLINKGATIPEEPSKTLKILCETAESMLNVVDANFDLINCPNLRQKSIVYRSKIQTEKEVMQQKLQLIDAARKAKKV